jgi:uncharacterized protein
LGGLGARARRGARQARPAVPALETVLGEFAQELLVSRRPIPERALAAGFVFRHPELEPALRDLLGG